MIEHATLEQVESVLLSKSFSEYVKSAWPQIESVPLIWNWHLDGLCDHLQAVSDGTITQDVVANVPPGTSKSLISSVLWPSWEWTTRPTGKWFHGSYDQHLSTRDSVKCRRLIESRWYQERWGYVGLGTRVFKLTGDQNLKTYFENDKGGYRMATSTGGHAMGEHPDRIVIDDPQDRAGADSEVKRQSVIDWWDQQISTRGVSIGVRRVIIMQRLREDDLSGHILAKGNCVHLCLPMRYEPGRMGPSPIGFKDPRTKPGELLAPVQFDEAKVLALEKALGSSGTAGQLQQRPSPAEGGLIKRHWWKRYTETPKGLDRLLFAWDCTFKGADTSDYVVGQAWGLLGAYCYLLDQTRGQWDITETIRQIRALREKWAKQGLTRTPDIPRILIEDKANGPAIISVLRHEVPGVIAWPPKGRRLDSKEARVQAVAPLIEAGQVWLPEGQAFTEQLVDEAAAFPNGSYDDSIDCCAHALGSMMPGAWSPQKAAEPPPTTLQELRARQFAEASAAAMQKPEPAGPARYAALNRR